MKSAALKNKVVTAQGKHDWTTGMHVNKRKL